MPRKIGVFHPGTQHSWQTALAFQETGGLGWYATSVFYDPQRWPYRIERWLPKSLSARVHRDFTRRHTPALHLENVRQFGFWEWLETGSRRAGAASLSHWANRRGNASFGKQVIRLVERDPVAAVWGYNTSSVEVFRWAKPRGIRCILDQTIGHCASMNQVMLAEQSRHPEFFSRAFTPFSVDAIAQQNEELSLADVVVVGSEFCAQTLRNHGCVAEKIQIVPYGYDETVFPTGRPKREPLGGRPIRFLFVGTIYPRKGVAFLLEAFESLPASDATLTLVGSLNIPPKTFSRFAQRITHIPSLSRQEVVKHFLEADCFIFPSLFEGGGIVLYEAAAAGLGIIQSCYCGDGVRGHRNGAILEDVSVAGLRMVVEALIADRSRLARWQQASWEMRTERSWRQYRERVRALAEI